MEIVAIEKKTFEQMTRQFVHFTKEVNELCRNDQSSAEWLDNQDVCNLLSISKRTLQSYRDNGYLAYSQVGHKCYYKKSDIEKLIKESTVKI